MSQHIILKEAREKMDKSLQALRQEIANIRTGRANPGMLDSVDIEVYGSKMKINQLGTVTVPDPHTIAIDLWDKSQMAAVEKCLRASPLDINPTNDGRLIRIPIPPLTEERRRDMVKLAGKMSEEAKVAVRNIRRHAVETIKQEQKDGALPEDDAHHLTDEIQKVTDAHIESIDEALKAKEADIMEV
ncbi:MAG TPA: ribosome recycling factor [Candidatus Hydrogenedentes bacterium]|jgi:ribosome recycling factor|nr:MAG: Ribosome-recycling factor [Candidatus Hydrogenedentes bacterium ADurb.Bin101]HOC68507.1 ribosome recycling factor [Candidatus Hydrogenedentota bacterium]HQM99984.1 ribosome recycling factor [Candidatus Hydrogenedentota bacterium]